MGVDERDFRRATEDVHFTSSGNKAGYASSTSGPVRYRQVAASGGGILGYLWYDDAENAAGYVPRKAAGDDAFNAGTYWYGHFAAAQKRGLAASEAVAEFEEQHVGGPSAGWIVPGSEAESPGVQQLKEYAGLSPSGTQSPRQRGESRGRGSEQ